MCIVLGKQDQALVLSRQEIEFVMHLSDLERVCDGTFKVFELTSIPGVSRPDGDQVKDKVDDLLDWIVDLKCHALGISPSNRSAVSSQPHGLFATRDVAQAASSMA